MSEVVRCLGLVGSLRSGLPMIYVQVINAEVQLRLGSHHTAHLLTNWVNTAALNSFLRDEDWRSMEDNLSAAAQILAAGGAKALVVCDSALNALADEVGRTVDLPVIGLVRAMEFKLREFRDVNRVAVVGPRTSREEAMWADELSRYRPLFPSLTERSWLTRCVDTASVKRGLSPDEKVDVKRIISTLRRQGARAIIFTEPLLTNLLTVSDTAMPIFDAAEVHAWVAGGWSAMDGTRPAAGCVCSVE